MAALCTLFQRSAVEVKTREACAIGAMDDWPRYTFNLWPYLLTCAVPHPITIVPRRHSSHVLLKEADHPLDPVLIVPQHLLQPHDRVTERLTFEPRVLRPVIDLKPQAVCQGHPWSVKLRWGLRVLTTI